MTLSTRLALWLWRIGRFRRPSFLLSIILLRMVAARNGSVIVFLLSNHTTHEPHMTRRQCAGWHTTYPSHAPIVHRHPEPGTIHKLVVRALVVLLHRQPRTLARESRT